MKAAFNLIVLSENSEKMVVTPERPMTISGKYQLAVVDGRIEFVIHKQPEARA